MGTDIRARNSVRILGNPDGPVIMFALLAPLEVGEYTQEQLPNATLTILEATGHLPHVSAPEETADTIIGYLSRAA